MVEVFHGLFALFAAFFLCVIFGGPVIGLLKKLRVQQTISEDAPERHLTKQGTPTMGGILILIPASIAALVFGGRVAVLPVLVMLAFGGIGFLDDLLIARRGKNLGLKARQKLALQFLFAGLAAFALWGANISTFVLWPWARGGGFDLGVAFYPLAALLIVGVSNAVNITDGLDGLASGTMAISMFVLAGAAPLSSYQPSQTAFPYAICGACIGFLWFNFFPAKVFMGDTGSLGLGAALAMMGIQLRSELLLPVFGFVFMIEALSVAIQVIYFKSTGGKRIFKMSPLHHHFELSGWAETQIVMRFWIVQIIAVAIGICLWAFSLTQ